MTEYEKEIWAELRRIFHQPYSVLKVKGGPNDSGLSWNPDFWVQKGNKTILIIKALGPDSTLENFDARMRDVFAVMALNWETSKHGTALSATAQAGNRSGRCRSRLRTSQLSALQRFKQAWERCARMAVGLLSSAASWVSITSTSAISAITTRSSPQWKRRERPASHSEFLLVI